MSHPEPGPYSPPDPAQSEGRLPLPLGKPKWAFILLGLIGAMFLVEQTLPMWIGYLGPYLPPQYQQFSPTAFQGGSTNNLVLILLGANYQPLVAQGEVWRFFTSMFLHIGFEHLLFNGYALFIFGSQMERFYGHSRFVTIYILAGLFGSLFSFAFREGGLSAGASGAIFGIIGTQVAFFFKYRHLLGEFGRSNLMNALIITGINVVFGLTSPGIDNLAHLGGLIAGVLLGYGLTPRYQVVDRYTSYGRVIDTASFVSQLWLPVLAIIILVAGTAAALGLI